MRFLARSVFVLSFSSSLQLCDADERVRAREETELEEKEDRGQCSINTPPSSPSVSVYKQLSQ